MTTTKDTLLEFDKTVDYYSLLNSSQIHSKEEITKAYRKQVLIWHPDKRPEDPNAAQRFHLIQKAYEILTHDKTREAYDSTLKAKTEKKKRDDSMDSKRRKMKQDLEQKEKVHKKQKREVEDTKRRQQYEMDKFKEEMRSKLQQQHKSAHPQQKEKEKEIAKEIPSVPTPSVSAQQHDDLEAQILAQMMEAAKKQKQDTAS